MAGFAVKVLFVFTTITFADAKTYNLTPEDSIQDTLDEVNAGDTINLAAGVYLESFKTKNKGKINDRITIQGPSDWDINDPSTQAIVMGDDSDNRVFEIRHSYYTIQDFTFDGMVGDTAASYRDKLIYVEGRENKAKEIEVDGIDQPFRSSIDGLIITRMYILHAGGECIRLRYFVTNAEISHNTIRDCGVRDYVLNPDSGNKNGEGLYVGTSSTQWEDNRTVEPDGSNYNWIHHNTFNTMGNEAVDVKEGGNFNIIEYNTVAGQLDEVSGGIDIRGDFNIVRYNTITENRGAGVRIGGNTVDGQTYGHFNRIYGNTLFKNENSGVKIMTADQELICENTITPTEPAADYSYTGGTYRNDYSAPEGACPTDPGSISVSNPEESDSVKAGKKVKVEWSYDLPSGKGTPIVPFDVRFSVELNECVGGDCGVEGCGMLVEELCTDADGCATNDDSYKAKLPKKSKVATSDHYVVAVGIVGTDVYSCSDQFTIKNGKLDSNF